MRTPGSRENWLRRHPDTDLQSPLMLGRDGDGIKLISLANSKAHLDDSAAGRAGWVKDHG